MSGLFEAALYGSVIAICFPLGALLVMNVWLSHHVIAAFMSVGAGLLVAAATIELTVGAFKELGTASSAATLIGAAALFSTFNWLVSRKGGKDRKRCGGCVEQPKEDEMPGSGNAIALGTVLDAIPEALVLGVVLSSGSGSVLALVVALALGNLAQAISSTSGLLHAGRSRKKVIWLWLALAVAVAMVTTGSYAALGAAGETVRPWVEAFAAGVLIAMTTEAMLPEAFEKSPPFRGLQAALGICIFMLVHRLV